jgi:hypothetical protein
VMRDCICNCPFRAALEGFLGRKLICEIPATECSSRREATIEDEVHAEERAAP